jgi:hypothetical protein
MRASPKCRQSWFGGSSKCEELPSLDLSWLRRKGKLTPGRLSSLTWSRGGYSVGSIKIQASLFGLHLSERSRLAAIGASATYRRHRKFDAYDPSQPVNADEENSGQMETRRSR